MVGESCPSQVLAEPPPPPGMEDAHQPTGLSYLAAADSSQTSALPSKTGSHNSIGASGNRFSGDSLSACLFWSKPTPAAPLKSGAAAEAKAERR